MLLRKRAQEIMDLVDKTESELGNTVDVTERFDKGLLDFGIIIGSTNLQQYDYLPLPTTDTWGLLMRKDSPLSASDTIKPKNLEDNHCFSPGKLLM